MLQNPGMTEQWTTGTIGVSAQTAQTAGLAYKDQPPKTSKLDTLCSELISLNSTLGKILSRKYDHLAKAIGTYPIKGETKPEAEPQPVANTLSNINKAIACLRGQINTLDELECHFIDNI